ncbi:GNAT family N-acetyltransferase [Magnetospirillum moscoviense]|uniref:GNAT family N-acetyltransferase n=1 Tax=Magnetospirillum moscoviense TaxID=1437059 RepID=UPI001FE0960E|nr:GNAT family N-acetyltransferase [Magnetospirillum moscoviense]
MATFTPGPVPPGLEEEWRDLESKSSGSAFLSWPWIAATGIAQEADTVLVRVRDDGRTIGLGLLGMGHSRLFALRPPALHLNESGYPARDRIMTEYNGLLTLAGRESEAAWALLAAMKTDKSCGKRDLALSGVAGHWRPLCHGLGLATCLLRPPQSAPFAALQIRPEHDLLAAMTRNSRQQIRRSMRHYEAHSPLILDRASDAAQALEWLDRLEALHTRSWRQRGKAGAFADPAFGDFHRRLISTGFHEGVTDLLRIQSGGEVIGYLYNLRWRGVAYAYQSGFRFDDHAQARPGLVAHVLAMQLYRGEGLTTYRFLAGQSRYKTSLASGQDELAWILAYRPGPLRWLASIAERTIGAIGAIAARSTMPRRIEEKACSNKKPS